jgi:uncharacterized protein
MNYQNSNIHPFVRDLAWVIESPPLYTHPNYLFPIQQGKIEKTLLNELAINPQPLIEHIKQTDRATLGAYYEQLVFFWLKNHPDVELLLTNYPIRTREHTLTELDCVFRYQHTIYHAELSIKFYLQRSENSWHESDFIGPNQKDSFKKKSDHLKTQLRSTELDETKRILYHLGIENPKPCLLFHGQLFYWHMEKTAHFASPNHLRGQLIQNHEQWLNAKSYYAITPQRNWLSPFMTIHPDQLVSHQQVINILETASRPQLVMKMQKQDGYFIETERVFLVNQSF